MGNRPCKCSKKVPPQRLNLVWRWCRVCGHAWYIELSSDSPIEDADEPRWLGNED